MKIGDKEFTPEYNNRTLYQLEEKFGDMPIHVILDSVTDFTLKQMGWLIYFGIKEKISEEAFVDLINPSQYVACAIECGAAIATSFGIKTEKKKKD